jgi:peptide/nickel transport system substrate-binding protein
MSRFRWLLAIVAALSVSLVLAACGGDDNGSSTTAGDADSPGALPEKQDLEGTKGGTLKVLASDDVDYIDPGQGYYQFTFMITYATQRPLYSWQPDDTTDPTPDLAADAPEISEDGKTVTVKIRPGVKYSPPVDRVVTSKDVKYAIERGFLPTVANGYAGAYFGDITGVKAFTDGKADDIAGIETPDDETVVFKLDRGTGGVVAGALSLPLSAPVPQEYAEEFDKKSPSTYGQNQVFTGPYQIKADSSGKITGYEPGKSIQLVRNPNWNGPETGDYRKAYLDAIDIDEGNSDTTVASRQILQGSGLANGDFSPPPPVLKQAVTQYQDQLALVPSGGNRYVSMNTTIAPFDNVDVRRAVFAAFDRAAMQKSRGGDIAGPVATHFIPEGMQGFDEAGGLEGPGFDFTKNPNGDLALAAEYLKKAGYEGGKYTGTEEILMVGTSGGVAQRAAEIAQAQFEKLGFNINLRLVTQDSMYTKFCNVPKAKVVVCPNVGWLKDFQDAQTILDPTFNGKNIVQENNSNWPQLDDPAVNKAMDEAALVTDPADRAKAWGEIDKQITNLAPAVPWIWDRTPNIWSKDVNGVMNRFNGNVDLSFTSLTSGQ